MKPYQWAKWAFPGGDKWSNWKAFTQPNIDLIPEGPGAYALGVRNRPVSRLLGVDLAGVLDIGESVTLRKRVQTLFACVTTPGETGHMAGWRLGSMKLLERMRVTASDLRITWCRASSKDLAYRMEGTLLHHYFDAFGELPPLNYKFNWSVWAE